MVEGGSRAETRRATAPNELLLTAVVALVIGAWHDSGLGADEPGIPPSQPAFEAGDISIGEPIPLPFAAPAVSQPPAATPAPPTASIAPPVAPPAVSRPAAAAAVDAAPASVTGAPGSGWLGIVVGESNLPGRWNVDEVAADGPAAAAGIRAGDEVRAINGLPLRTSDDVAQALTVITPGQQVRMAIARDEQVADVTLAAVQRPPASRAWVTAATAQELPPTPLPVQPPAALETAPRPASPPAFSRDSLPGYAGSSPVATPAPQQPARVEPQAAQPSVRGRTALGVRTVPIDPEIQSRFRLSEASGAYVIGVVGDLPASRAGVPPGSVIVAIDQRPVRSPDELTRLVTSGPVGRPVPLEYRLPGGTSHRADVILQTLELPLEEALVGLPEPAATPVPSLQPQPAPTTARRPTVSTDSDAALRNEIRRLEARIELLEQHGRNR